jgi:CRISPR-associated protein Cmr3
MAIKSYLLTFRPIDVFFWGNEKTLNDDNLSYFVHSNKYPQQTTLLGALRYKLLEANGLLSFGKTPIDDKAHTWIGKSSFSLHAPTNAYGYTDKLSPVFLKDGTDAWHPVPKDCGCSFKTILASVKMSHSVQNSLGFFDGFDAKKGSPESLIKGDGVIKPLDEIFKEDVRIGIQKDVKIEAKALFKQSYYRFIAPKMSFATVAYLDEIAGKCLIEFIKKSPFVRMGAEQRSFEMSMSENETYDNFFQMNHTNTSEFTKIILLSDAYVEPKIYDHCVGVLSETVDFRNIETNKDTQYWKWNTGKDSKRTYPNKLTIKRNLLEKGSVFYLKKGSEQAFEDSLKEHKNFRKIGYNAYLKFASNANKPTISIF